MVKILALSVVLSAFSSCAVSQEGIVPSKNYATRKIKVGNFDGISTSSSIDVIYTQTSGQPDVEIYAPDNLMECVKVEVKDGVLKVGFQSKNKREGVNIKGKHQTEVRVSAPAVHAFRASSSGDIILKNGLRTQGRVTMMASSSGDVNGSEVVCDELVADASSSGDVVLDKVECMVLDADASSSGDVEIKELKAKNVNATASSSGDVVLSGVCHSAKFSASSSGDVEAKNLMANEVKAKASSSGDITCNAIDALDVTISSSGTVSYKGNPKRMNYHPKSGLKKID